MERTVGIMVYDTGQEPPFADERFYAKLCTAGEELGVRVFVFAPVQADPDKREVEGYFYTRSSQSWQRRTHRMPDLVYDRVFCPNGSSCLRHRRALYGLMSGGFLLPIGRSLPGKWEVHRTLAADPELAPHMPHTERLLSMRQLKGWLAERGEAFLKPNAGTHGKGAIHLQRIGDGSYSLDGRDRENRIVREKYDTAGGVLRRATLLAGSCGYLVQQALSLSTAAGTAYDIRCLMQKDGTGRWQLTGMAVRQGNLGSVTSNLHGGGHAEHVLPFLQKEFGPRQAAPLAEKLRTLSMLIPPALESRHGRLAELGIDLGVDREGSVWIIEANSKPGRQIFTQLSDDRAAASAVRNPIAYARFLLQSGIRANVREADANDTGLPKALTI